MQALPAPATLPAGHSRYVVNSEQRSVPDPDFQSSCFRNHFVTLAKSLGLMGIGATFGAAVGATAGAIAFTPAASGAAAGAVSGATFSGIHIPGFVTISNILGRRINNEQPSEYGAELCRFRDRTVARSDVILLLKSIVANTAVGAAAGAVSGAAGGATFFFAFDPATDGATGFADGTANAGVLICSISCTLAGALLKCLGRCRSRWRGNLSQTIYTCIRH